MHTLTKCTIALCALLSPQGCRDMVIGGSPENEGDASFISDTCAASDGTDDSSGSYGTDTVSDMDSGVERMDTDDWHMDSEDWHMGSEDWGMGSDRNMGRKGETRQSD